MRCALYAYFLWLLILRNGRIFPWRAIYDLMPSRESTQVVIILKFIVGVLACRAHYRQACTHPRCRLRKYLKSCVIVISAPFFELGEIIGYILGVTAGCGCSWCKRSNHAAAPCLRCMSFLGMQKRSQQLSYLSLVLALRIHFSMLFLRMSENYPYWRPVGTVTRG